MYALPKLTKDTYVPLVRKCTGATASLSERSLLQKQNLKCDRQTDKCKEYIIMF